ncbi:MAG: hypothetical protein M1417_00570 [Candidatus Thermoplasmatota archaeon]|nr:hypothetical protein [Candidatus Thermoplasmatota archaeon]MCL5437182.1 hypothetical protein [Candidatus Thermoplasmatota archaeon]
MEFIPMLTKDDLTVKNALEILDEIRYRNITKIGFKNIGVDYSLMKEIVSRARIYGLESYMEVVSTSRKEARNSFEAGLKLGVDNLIGGTFPATMSLAVLKAGRRTGRYPFIGNVTGHPNNLSGDFERFREDIENLEWLGADGIDLLAFRYDSDPYALLEFVVKSTSLPVIVAGSIDSVEKIRRLKSIGVWGFTVGTAMIDRSFRPGGSIADQVDIIMEECR